MSVTASSPVRLRRVLPFRTVVSTSTGLAYAAISLLGCVQLASFLAGDSAWIALLVAGALAALAALCFSELNALYPSAAAIRQYIRAAFTENASLTISFGYVLTIIAVIAADSYVVGSAITYAFPGTPTLLWILLILAGAAGANLLGIRIAGLLQDVTTYALLLSLGAISVVALAHGGFALTAPFGVFASSGGALDFVNAVAVGVFVFSAFEWVTPLSEEIADTRLIPRGMFVALALLFVSYALFTIAATHTVGIAALCQPSAPGGHDCQMAAPQMLLGHVALGQLGVYWMLAATLITGVMTFNGGFATASRFLYAAAREATLPPVFARLSIPRLVPWVAVVALAVSSAAVAVAVDLTRQYVVLIYVGAVLEALIYAVAGLCVIQLRRRAPAAPRSFRVALGWTLPLLTIVIFGALGLVAALTTTTLTLGTTTLTLPLPLILTMAVFALSFVYVRASVPHLKAAEAARLQARSRRRPQRSEQEPSVE